MKIYSEDGRRLLDFLFTKAFEGKSSIKKEEAGRILGWDDKKIDIVLKEIVKKPEIFCLIYESLKNKRIVKFEDGAESILVIEFDW